jgi:glycosyltransferase involved in cell wall biosynthesis
MGAASGLYWLGPIHSDGGYGSVARNYIQALRSVGIPVRAFNVGPDHRALLNPASVQALRECERTDLGPRPVAVLHGTPEMVFQAWPEGVSARVNVSIFETHSIPPEWAVLCNAVDRVWLPSAFNRVTYARGGVAPDKLRVIPLPVDTDFWHPGVPRARIPGAGGFVFLYVFGFGWRKGFDVLLRAYASEFQAGEDVTLVLKVHPMDQPVATVVREVLASGAPEYRHGVPGMPRVLILTDPMSEVELRTLYASCDLMISTDRASGWGYPCMEAMSMGRAAAALDWGGSPEFMTHGNSFLIPTEKRLEPVDARLSRSWYVYYGQRWPAVEVGAIRRVLRQAFDDRALLRERAERGAADVRGHFTFERIGHRFREALADLGDLPPPSPGSRVLPMRIRQRLMLQLKLQPWRRAAWESRFGREKRGWVVPLMKEACDVAVNWVKWRIPSGRKRTVSAAERAKRTS